MALTKRAVALFVLGVSLPLFGAMAQESQISEFSLQTTVTGATDFIPFEAVGGTTSRISAQNLANRFLVLTGALTDYTAIDTEGEFESELFAVVVPSELGAYTTATAMDTEAEFESLFFAITVPSELTGVGVSFADGDSNYTATSVGEAIEELFLAINSGFPNAATGKVDWSQLVNVPADFADNTDDGGGSVGADSIGTSELDDSSDSPAVGNFVTVDSSSTARFEYLTNSEVLAQIGAEAETHATEHEDGGNDELAIEDLATGCADGEAAVSDGAGDAVCTDVVLPAEIAAVSEKNFSFYHSSDLTTYDEVAKVQFANAVTITEVACSTDVGTVSINFYERAEAAPNTGTTDAITADLVCDDDQQATTTFTDAAIDADDWLTLAVEAVASSPTVVNITVKYELQ